MSNQVHAILAALYAANDLRLAGTVAKRVKVFQDTLRSRGWELAPIKPHVASERPARPR